MFMRVNIDKTKFMIIKSEKITHGSFVYDNHCLEQVSSYKVLTFLIHLVGIIASRKELLEVGKLIMNLKTIVS